MEAPVNTNVNPANLPATTDARPPALLAKAPQGTSIFTNRDLFEQAQRVAKAFAESQLVPSHFRNKLPDCLIAVGIAWRMQEDELTVFQNLAVVNGRPCWMTQYMIARAMNAGVFSGPITWKSKGAGEDLEVTAQATLASTGEIVDITCTMKMAKAEGWTSNKKYQTMPEQMLRWRSASWLIRLYCPQVMMGVPTMSEAELPMQSEMIDVTERSTRVETNGPPRQIPRKEIEETAEEVTEEEAPKATKVRTRKPKAEPAPAPATEEDFGPIPTKEAAKPEPEPDKPDPVEIPDDIKEEVAEATKADDYESLVAEFEEVAPLCLSEEDLIDAAAELVPLVEGKQLSPDLERRCKVAWAAAKKAIAAKTAEVAAADAKAKAEQEKVNKVSAIDTESPAYKRGLSDGERGLKTLLNPAIKSDPALVKLWEAGHAEGTRRKEAAGG